MINPIVFTLGLAVVAFLTPIFGGRRMHIPAQINCIALGLFFLTMTLVIMVFFIAPVP